MKIISCNYIKFYTHSGYLMDFEIGIPVDIISWLSDIEELGIDYTGSKTIFDLNLNDGSAPIRIVESDGCKEFFFQTRIVDSDELGDSVYEEICKDFFFENSYFDKELGLYNREIFYCLDEEIEIWFDKEGVIQKIEYRCCPESDFEQRIDVEYFEEIK